MKKLILVFVALSAIVFGGCEGDPGPPGPAGEPGINILGQVFEVTVNFNQTNGFSQLIQFPGNVEVFESDAVLVYLLEDVIPGNGGSIDVWSQLPQTFFLSQGTLLYSFDYTFLDVRIFLDANFDLNTLDPVFTQNQTFRIAVVPSEFANANLTMGELLNTLEIEPGQIELIGQ